MSRNTPGAEREAMRLPPARAWLLGAAGVVATLLVWTLAALFLAGTIGTVNRLAPPWEVARFIAVYATDRLVVDVWSSLTVFLGGWLIGGASAILLGLLLGRVRLMGQMFLPIIEAIRPVSSIVWLPLTVVWFGFGHTSKSLLVGLAVFLVVIVYAVDGCARIPRDLQRTAIMLGMSRGRRLWNLILPATLGESLIGLRVALMAGWGTVIIAELVAADTGLGARLIASQRSFNVAAVMAVMVCFGATGYILDSIFSWLQTRLLPWQQAAQS